MELGLGPIEAAIVFATAFVGGVIRGFTGFGSALALAPVVSVTVGPLLAVPAILLTLSISTAQLIPGALGAVDWRRVMPLGIAGCIGAPLGVYLLVSVDQDVMRRAIAVAVVLFTLAMMGGWRYRKTPGRMFTMGIGGLGGALSGAASIGGPPVIAFLLASPESAASNRAAIIFYFLFTQVTALALFWAEGVIVAQVLWLAVLMLPAQMIGIWFGERLFPKAGEATYRKVALGFLLAIGLVSLMV